jgi:hypothetical protein
MQRVCRCAPTVPGAIRLPATLGPFGRCEASHERSKYARQNRRVSSHRHLRLALRKRRIIPRIARCGIEPKNRLGCSTG